MWYGICQCLSGFTGLKCSFTYEEIETHKDINRIVLSHILKNEITNENIGPYIDNVSQIFRNPEVITEADRDLIFKRMYDLIAGITLKNEKEVRDSLYLMNKI